MKTISPIICVAALLFSVAASANTSKVYTLKGERVSGSMLPSVEATSPISFHKRYKNLTGNEKLQVRKMVGSVSDSDTPPFPKFGLQSVYRPVIDAYKQLDAKGSLHLNATINENGFVESVRVVQSPNEKLSVAAERILRNTQFDPASCNGTACEMSFPIMITFN